MFKGYIYLLYNEINNDLYVGLTERSIKERFYQHIREAKDDNGSQNLLYTNMRNVGIDNCKITCLEEFEFKGENIEYFKQSLKKLEDKWIIRIKPSLNTAMPSGYTNDNEIKMLNMFVDKVKSKIDTQVQKQEWNDLDNKYEINIKNDFVLYRNKESGEIIEFKKGDIILTNCSYIGNCCVISNIRSNAFVVRKIINNIVETRYTHHLNYDKFMRYFCQKVEA